LERKLSFNGRKRMVKPERILLLLARLFKNKEAKSWGGMHESRGVNEKKCHLGTCRNLEGVSWRKKGGQRVQIEPRRLFPPGEGKVGESEAS